MNSGWTKGGLLMTEPAPPHGPDAPMPYLGTLAQAEMGRRLEEACFAHRNQNQKLVDLHLRELARLLCRYGMVK
jgi:hypothetical protein